jgi:hypothetical protein
MTIALAATPPAPATSAALTAEVRGARQLDIVPAEELARTAVALVGCGAIGSHLARFLAHLGVPHLTLIDPDSVAPENLALQGFAEADLGRAKAEALADTVGAVAPLTTVRTVVARFNRGQLGGVPPELSRRVVCSCVDDIEVRGQIHAATRDRRDLWLDGRMTALVYRVLTADDLASDKYYRTTLFRRDEAPEVRCTAKGTVFTAAAPALAMGTQLLLHLKGGTTAAGSLERDLEGNLLTQTFGPRPA